MKVKNKVDNKKEIENSINQVIKINFKKVRK